MLYKPITNHKNKIKKKVFLIVLWQRWAIIVVVVLDSNYYLVIIGTAETVFWIRCLIILDKLLQSHIRIKYLEYFYRY